MPPASPWGATDAVRTLVAGIAIVASLAMIWWGWAHLDAGPADLLMRTMVSVVTGALGYLFGRGDVDRVTRIAQEEHEGRAFAVGRLEASDRAFSDAEQPSLVLEALSEMAERDARLAQKIYEARRKVNE